VAPIDKRLSLNGVVCVEEGLKALGEKFDGGTVQTRAWIIDAPFQEVFKVAYVHIAACRNWVARLVESIIDSFAVKAIRNIGTASMDSK
jgi:hypothetical protein